MGKNRTTGLLLRPPGPALPGPDCVDRQFLPVV
jgi:hypothetical protein